MTGSQYNNVVRWTLANGASDNSAGSAAAAKAVFNNCGVAFPSGNNLNILLTLMSDDYMAWRACTLKQARDYANKGIAAVGVDANRVVVITPDNSVLDRTSTLAAAASGSDTLAMSADAISPTERTSMQFFAYYALETDPPLPAPHGYYNSYYYSQASVCNDGIGDDYEDPYHSDETAYMNGILNADVHRYIVFPSNAPNLSSMKGCVGVVLRTNGNYQFGIVGEAGPDQPYPPGNNYVHEFSVKMVQDLGYSTDCWSYVSSGGGMVYIFPDTKRSTWTPSDTLNATVQAVGEQYFY